MGDVIEFGELRVRRAARMQYINEDRCRHFNMTVDDNGEVVTCDDCGKQLGAFWALRLITEQYEQAWKKVAATGERIKEEAAKSLHLRAALKVEQAWRSRSMVPTCPHCHQAIFPEDGFGGSGTNRRMAIARREKARAPSPAMPSGDGTGGGDGAQPKGGA
jgi:hypothetical protein